MQPVKGTEARSYCAQVRATHLRGGQRALAAYCGERVRVRKVKVAGEEGDGDLLHGLGEQGRWAELQLAEAGGCKHPAASFPAPESAPVANCRRCRHQSCPAARPALASVWQSETRRCIARRVYARPAAAQRRLRSLGRRRRRRSRAGRRPHLPVPWAAPLLLRPRAPPQRLATSQPGRAGSAQSRPVSPPPAARRAAAAARPTAR